jgi:hypothetical protein
MYRAWYRLLVVTSIKSLCNGVSGRWRRNADDSLPRREKHTTHGRG